MIKLDPYIQALLAAGTVIPAHPLALTADFNIDEPVQRGLTRYYLASGAGGVAVGVHTTQFEIRQPGVNLLEPVLALAAEEIASATPDQPVIKVAGVVGPTEQALREAALAVRHGYHLGLLSMGGLADYSEDELINRAQRVAEVIPIFGFYLQPAVGGRDLSYNFWRRFVEIPQVNAIKVAAFNRYNTLDVVRAVCRSSRREDIALYTGNDDNIVADLLTPYRFIIEGQPVEKRFVGGLLGHWAYGTPTAVELLKEIKRSVQNNYAGIDDLLARGVVETDINAAIFDPAHRFQGCLSGIHEMLRRQGLMTNIYCLNPHEKLSPGQMEEIERVIRDYNLP